MVMDALPEVIAWPPSGHCEHNHSAGADGLRRFFSESNSGVTAGLPRNLIHAFDKRRGVPPPVPAPATGVALVN